MNRFQSADLMQLSSVRTVILIHILGTLFLGGCVRSWMLSSGPIDRFDLPLKIKSITPSLYLVEEYNYWKVNRIFYHNKRGFLFVDAGWSYSAARRLIMDRLWEVDLKAEPDGILVTSHTLNQTGGLAAFYQQRIPIFMHKNSPSEITKSHFRLNNAMSRNFGSWRESPRIYPDQTLSGGEDLMNGAAKVIYPGVAYTRDNLAIYFPEEKILYAGLILKDPPSIAGEGRPAEYLKALLELKKLGAERVIAGNGSPMHGAEIIEDHIRIARSRIPARVSE